MIKPRVDLESGELRLADPSLFAILGSNLFVLVLAITQGWPLGEILWIYWAQSVIIGITNFIRLRSLRSFSTDGLTMNGSPVPETPAARNGVAGFFLLHFGFFHLVYMVFLWIELDPFSIPASDLLLFILSIALFGASHFYSLIHNRREDLGKRTPNIGTLMFYPYLRIIPMHITIIFGSILAGSGLWLFMGLKTLADIGMHMVEHALFRQEHEGVTVRS